MKKVLAVVFASITVVSTVWAFETYQQERIDIYATRFTQQLEPVIYGDGRVTYHPYKHYLFHRSGRY